MTDLARDNEQETCPFASSGARQFLDNLIALRPTRETKQAVNSACTCGWHRFLGIGGSK